MRERSSTVQREMAATPAEIWAYRLDFRNLPAYNPDVQNLELRGRRGRDGVGATYGFELVARGVPSPSSSRSPGPSPTGSWPSRCGALPAAEVFTVEALETDGDRPRSSVTIALTCASRTSTRPMGTTSLLASGVRQLDDELDAMEPRSRSPVAEVGSR